MAELKENEIAIDRQQLNVLLTLNETQREEIKQLYFGSIQLLEMLGLAENGKVKAEAFADGANPLPEILKEASSLIGLVMQAGAPFGMGKKAEKKLIEKFSFFTQLIPLFIKIGNEHQTT
jgi:hypothetical protein